MRALLGELSKWALTRPCLALGARAGACIGRARAPSVQRSDRPTRCASWAHGGGVRALSVCNSESSRRRAIERILREVGACSRADSQHREEGQAGQSWSATTESGRRRGLRARPAALCLFGRRPSLTHAHCGPVTRRFPRATGTVDRALRTLGMASRRRRRALMVLGRLDGCVWSRGGAPTGGAVIDGHLRVILTL